MNRILCHTRIRAYVTLTLFLLWHITACTSETPQPIEIVQCETIPAQVEAVKEAITYAGVDGNYLSHGKTALGWWHAEIEIIFSNAPVDLEIVNMSTTHFMRDYKQSVHWVRTETDFSKYDWQDWNNRWAAIVDWEQNANTLTLLIAFHGRDLFAPYWEAGPLTYEQIKEKYPGIDGDTFVAYTLDFTLHWHTGRKRFTDIPIKPSDEICRDIKQL